MTKFHLVSVVILTLVSSIFSFPQQADDLQPRVELLETTVAQLSARVKALETPVNINADSSKAINPTDDSEKTEIDYEVDSIDAKITESNSVYVKYAWILTVKNNGKKKLLFNANIEFLDADGFIVDQDFAYRLLIEPYETKRYTGAKLVNTSIAGSVTQISAKTNVVSFDDVADATTPTPEETIEAESVKAIPTPESETKELRTIVDEKQQYGEHIVQSGDTIASIAIKYHTTKEVIIEINSIADENLLFVGQKLRIPTDVAQPKQLEAMGSTSFENPKYAVSVDSCEYQSTSDDKTFDRYICTKEWKNKSSKAMSLDITIHLYDSNGVELTSSAESGSYAPDSSSTSSIKVLVDYPQAAQVAKYSVTVEER